MAYNLGDIYIGNYPQTQAFGARPDVYSARFGIRGHNGIDIGCPSLTPVLSAADGFVSEIGFDAGGFGNYLKIVHDGYLTLYAHLNDIVVKKGERVLAGQLIAHSNNTGFSDAPHLHFGVAPCDTNGNKTEPDNGYSGYIDPNSELCHWEIKNLTEPVKAISQTEEQKVPVLSSDFVRMVAQGTNYKVIASYLIGHGLNTFLSANGRVPIDLENNGSDPEGGNSIVLFLTNMISELKDATLQNQQLQAVSAASSPESVVQNLTSQQKDSFLTSIISSVKGFIFK